MTWTTKLSDLVPEMLASYGADEIYCAYFAPPRYQGAGPTVSLGLPECELQMVQLNDNGEPVAFVNRPTTNRNAREWIKNACQLAVERQAIINFNCDTLEQLERAIRLAGRFLPGYERVALERMEKPESRGKGNLS